MHDLECDVVWPSDFSGTVRLFPLPDLVLFPHVVQPLHVFETRYFAMLNDALEGDKLIAMALLEKGWEHQYDHRPKVAATVCIGKIISHTETDDGKYNVLLVGLKRARITEELDTNSTFREARVELLEDFFPPEDTVARPELMGRLQELFSKFVPEGLAAQESFKQLVGKQLPLGILTDTITYALNLPLAIKQQLLAEHNVDIRCRILTRCLEQQLVSKDSGSCTLLAANFPPKFSKN